MTSVVPDYNKWTKDFTYSFNYSTGERFSPFFPTFELLIDEFLDNYSLLPPNNKQTSHFLYSFVPTISSKIYQLRNLQNETLELAANQLLKILNLCSSLSEQNDFKLNKTLKNILNPNQNIYKLNSDLYSTICQLFISDDYQRLISRCISCKPGLKNLSLLFSIRKQVLTAIEIDASEIISIMPAFLNQYKGDSIRTIDSSKLKRIIPKYIYPLFISHPTTNFIPFLHFCEILVLSGILDKKLIGIDFINKFIIAKNQTTVNQFHQWISNQNQSNLFLEYLSTDHTMHIEVLKSARPIYLYISSTNLITPDYIESLYITSNKMQEEEQNLLYQYIIQSLSELSNANKNKEIISGFLKAHKDNSKLLVNAIKNSKLLNDLFLICIHYLFENKAVNEIKSITTKDSYKPILDEVMNCPKNQESLEVAVQILSYLLLQYPDLHKLLKTTQESFLHSIVSKFSLNNDFSMVYLPLKSFLIKNKQTLKLELLIELFDWGQSTNYDPFWLFLDEILQANNRRAMDSDSLNQILLFIESISDSYFPLSSSIFINFLRTFILVKSQLDCILDFTNFTKFQFTRLPKSFLPILTKLYFTTKEHDLINQLMFEIFVNCSMISEISKLLITDFLPNLDQKKYHLVKLIYDVLIAIEKDIHLDDFGITPKRRFRDLTNDDIQISLKTKSDPRIFRKIYESPNTISIDFVKRIQTMMCDNTATVSYNVFNLHSENPLKQMGVNHDCEITISTGKKFYPKDQLSLLLTKTDDILLEKLFFILKTNDDEQLNEITWNLIQFLPLFEKPTIDIEKSENVYVLKYYIQIISHLSQVDRTMIESLIKVFHSRKFKKSDSSIIQILIKNYDHLITQNDLELLIDPLFECMNSNSNSLIEQKKNLNFILQSTVCSNCDSEEKLIAIQLLKKLTKVHKQPMVVLLSNKINEVVELILKVNQKTARKLMAISENISDISRFMRIFIEKLNLNPNSTNFEILIGFFSSFWKGLLQNKCLHNVESLLLNKCIEFVQIKSRSTPRLCTNFYKTVKFTIKNQSISKEIIDSIDRFITTLFDILYIEDDHNISSFFIEYINQMKKIDQKANQPIISPIVDKNFLNMFSKMKSNTHFNMSENKYQKVLYPGLQNLGVTCFINTIIQPLFYTYQLRYDILNDSENLLHDLFVQLSITQRGFAKMKGFANQFQKDIDIHHQQDCMEFLLLLIEKLDLTYQNYFKGIQYDYVQQNNEMIEAKQDFITLSVNVQKSDNLNDSLKKLFENSLVVSSSETQKFSKIAQAPQFLIINLNRFEYNLQTYQKTKINSQFSFPLELDITDYVQDYSETESEYKYELYAVSLHSGSADSGHFISFVKINNKWIEFNDKVSTEITESQMTKTSFGSSQSKINAYLLYYRRIFTTNLYNEEIIEPILGQLTKNIERTEHLCMYNESIREYMCNEPNVDILISYYFNVLCRSTSKTVKEFVDLLIQKVQNEGDRLFDFLSNDYQYFLNIFTKSKNEQIIFNTRRLILSFSNNPKCTTFLTSLIQHLNIFFEKPRRIDNLIPIFLCFIQKQEETNLQIAIENKWDDEILSFISNCSTKLRESDQKKMRISDLLIILNMIAKKSIDHKIIDTIAKHLPFLLQNPYNSIHLMNLYRLYSDSSFIQFIEQSISQSTKQNNLMMNFIFGLIECEIELNTLSSFLKIANQKVETCSYFSTILRDPDTTSCVLSSFLIENYREVILSDLLHMKKDTRLRAEYLTYDLFIDVKPLSAVLHYTNPKMSRKRTPTDSLFLFTRNINDLLFDKVDIPLKKYDDSFYVNFLRMVKFSIKRTNSPNSPLTSEFYSSLFMKVFNLFEYINSQSSCDLNYLAIFELFRVFPYHKMFKEQQSFDAQIKTTILSSLKYLSSSRPIFHSVSKYIKSISTNHVLVIQLFENENFLSFFRSQKQIREDLFNFDFFYETGLKIVLPNSNLYRNESISIIQSNGIDNEIELMKLLLETSFDLLPGEFVVEVIKWIAKSVFCHSNPILYKPVILILNSVIPNSLKNHNRNLFSVEKLFDKNSEISSSIDSIGLTCKLQSKDKNTYLELLENVLRVSEYQNFSVASDSLLSKLLSKLALIDGNNVVNYSSELLFYFDLLIASSRYEYVSSFVENIFALTSLSTWVNKTKLCDYLLQCYKLPKTPGKEIQSKNDSIEFIFIEILININITSYNEYKSNDFLTKFVKDVKLDALVKIIDAVRDIMPKKKPTEKKMIIGNLKKLTRTRAELSQYIPSIEKL